MICREDQASVLSSLFPSSLVDDEIYTLPGDAILRAALFVILDRAIRIA
jgi:hypothetical protein